MKACENCNSPGRVVMDENYEQRSVVNKFFGVLTVYIPVLTLPFVFFSAYVTYFHLKLVGAKNIRPLKSFFPDRSTFRYNYGSQITMKPGYIVSPVQSKLYWILNCTWYCPVSVGLFEWHAYLVKLVENWWCPFHHNRKESNYQDGAIDKSFWHIYPEDVVKLHPEDRDNPIWNAEFAKGETEADKPDNV